MKRNDVLSDLPVRWNQDGSRKVDEKLVMYNNPLFTERLGATTEPHSTPDSWVDPVTGLRDNSDWVAIFESYNFEQR
ncbi:hypothetical protein AC249_AIPGENE20511 [Exaiptasia diaphana]|nr:hypothetical protein AC249_AIPGENE20511 [Exaiptasia diaphana]